MNFQLTSVTDLQCNQEIITFYMTLNGATKSCAVDAGILKNKELLLENMISIITNLIEGCYVQNTSQKVKHIDVLLENREKRSFFSSEIKFANLEKEMLDLNFIIEELNFLIKDLKGLVNYGFQKINLCYETIDADAKIAKNESGKD